jgi:hypothetical protein
VLETKGWSRTSQQKRKRMQACMIALSSTCECGEEQGAIPA